MSRLLKIEGSAPRKPLAERRRATDAQRSFEILGNPPDKDTNGDVIGFTPYFTTQFGLPHRPVKGNEWVRQNGVDTLRVINYSRQGIPFGSLPRIILAWVATWQVRHPSATVIELGKNLSRFMEDELQLPRTGRYIKDVKKQLKCLFTCIVSVTTDDVTRDHFDAEGKQIARRIVLWGNPAHSDQDALWESYIILTDEFRESLLENPVPIDTRAFPLLTGSPLAVDYYLYFARTMFSLRKSRLVTWAQLHAQFGSSYNFTDKYARNNFRAESRKQITTRVRNAYPTLRVHFDQENKGIWLHPSPTPVPASPKRVYSHS